MTTQRWMYKDAVTLGTVVPVVVSVDGEIGYRATEDGPSDLAITWTKGVRLTDNECASTREEALRLGRILLAKRIREAEEGLKDLKKRRIV